MIYIIFRPINHSPESAVPLCLEFDKIMREHRVSLPIGWNLPPQVLQNSSQTLLTYLSRRGAEYGDMLIFPGKTGKPHHTLTVNQVKRELYQFSGEYQLPVWNGYFPYHIDLHRPELIEYYEKKTVLLIEGIDKVYNSTEHGVISFELLLGDSDAKQALKTIRKCQGKSLFVLIEPRTVKDLQASVELLEVLHQSGLASPLPSTLVGQKTEFQPLEEIRGCTLPPAARAQNDSVQPHSWDIIANMPGSVVLEEEDMKVHFNKGNLYGILKGSGNLLPRMEARGYIEKHQEPANFVKDSSFSFTGDSERGLRDRIALPSGNGTPPWLVIRDYYFNEEEPGLHISLWWKAAKISPDTEKISLLEVPITITHEQCLFSYRDLHGETHSLKLTGPARQQERKVMIFSGDRFSFSPAEKESVPVTFIFDRPTERAMVELKRLKKAKDVFLVTFTPGGMYAPRRDASLELVQERIDFRLHAGDSAS